MCFLRREFEMLHDESCYTFVVSWANLYVTTGRFPVHYSINMDHLFIPVHECRVWVRFASANESIILDTEAQLDG